MFIPECVVGYYRPVQDWNRGKQEEFGEKQYIDLSPMKASGREDSSTKPSLMLGGLLVAGW